MCQGAQGLTHPPWTPQCPSQDGHVPWLLHCPSPLHPNTGSARSSVPKCPQTMKHPRLSPAGWQGKGSAAMSKAMSHGAPSTRLPWEKPLTGALSLGATVPAAAATRGSSPAAPLIWSAAQGSALPTTHRNGAEASGSIPSAAAKEELTAKRLYEKPPDG